jgi:hypothetical protein
MSSKMDDIAGTTGAVPVCATCGSERVVTDAWACWEPRAGLWELETSFDQAHCLACEDRTTLKWTFPGELSYGRVRELNDAFRTRCEGAGTVLMTRGLAELGHDQMIRIVEAVRAFDHFTEDNDPYGEHDFGALEIDGERIFWKIDCYDLAKEAMSPNPGNPAVTHRVMTIMLASEY